MKDVFLYSLIAAIALLISGSASSWLPMNKQKISAFQHFAAGVVFAAVAVELLPLVMKSELKFDIALGFLAGVATMLLIRAIGQKTRSSLGMVSGIGIDLFIDGILIGLAFVASKETGILILIALTIEVLFLGLSLMPTQIKKQRFLILVILSTLIPAGAILGALFISHMPPQIFEASLAFGIAALLFLVTEELLVEAHESKDTLWGASAFFIGFLVIMLLH